MALRKTENTEASKIEYTFKVLSARKIAETKKGGDIISFNVSINGVTVNGATLTEYENKAGEVDYIVAMPQRQGKDRDGNTKYFDIVFVPISKENRKKIVSDCIKMITEV